MRTKRLARAATSALLAAPLAAWLAPADLLAQTPDQHAATAAVSTAAVAAAPISASAPNGVGSAFELTFWQSVAGSEDAATYEAYLARYPDGTFSGLARARIAALQRAATVQPAATEALPAAPIPTAQAAPAVLQVPQAAQPLAPTPAAAVSTAGLAADVMPAAPAAEMIPAAASASMAAPVAVAAAAPSPLSRLLAQLRGSNDAPTAPSSAPMPPSAPFVTAAPPVQPLAAANPGLAQPTPAPLQPAIPAATAPAAAAAASGYASARPLLLPVPDVPLPAYFCSNDARNLFHNNAYRPAVEVATRNNEAAVLYLRQLQQTYDRGQLGRDTAVLNAIASEARAYQAEAARAYTVQAALVRQFDALMAVPLRACAATAQ